MGVGSRLRSVPPGGAAAVVALLGLMLALGTALWVKGRNARFAAEHFTQAADRVVAQVEGRLSRYQYGLRGVRGAAVALDGALTQAAFRRYSRTRNIPEEFPGARGFGFVRRVAPADLPAYLRGTRAEAGEDFAIRELSPNAGEHFIIQYVDPVEPNRGAIGLDIASQPERRAAAIRAMETGAIAMTGPITLVQSPDKAERGFLAFLPILAPGRPEGTVEERRAATLGWSYTPLSSMMSWAASMRRGSATPSATSPPGCRSASSSMDRYAPRPACPPSGSSPPSTGRGGSRFGRTKPF